MESIEVWKPVVGYEGLYEVSNFGEVRSVTRMVNIHHKAKRIVRGRVLRHNFSSGYDMAALSKNSVRIPFCVHRLMMEAFVPNPFKLPCVNHKNENKLDNFIFVNPDGSVDLEKSNLEWCPYSYNNGYGTKPQRIAQKLKKPVSQFKDGVLIRTLKGAIDFKVYGFSPKIISMCCKGQRKSHKGFQFSFA